MGRIKEVHFVPKSHLPKIVIGQSDHASLTRLANDALERLPAVAEELLTELDRAKLVSDRAVPANVVRMGSHVVFRAEDGPERQVELVYPGKADISEGRVSIMTPIGAALIGLAEGQSIAWTARDGKAHRLTVLKVDPPGTAREDAGITYLRMADVRAITGRDRPDDDDPGPAAA